MHELEREIERIDKHLTAICDFFASVFREDVTDEWRMVGIVRM